MLLAQRLQHDGGGGQRQDHADRQPLGIAHHGEQHLRPGERGDVDAVAKTIGASVVENDQVKARDLPGPLQEALLKLSLGETSPPFGSISEGVRMLMLCGRDDPKVDSGPKFEEIMSQMEDDRVNKRAQAYLRDLRRDAVIEYN